jgi:hypothetical protein
MIWVPIRGARADFPDHTLVLPSCDTGRVDQLALDCLCFNAGTFVGRLISQNLDFVASQDPYHGDSTTLSSAIDVYRGDIPALGPSIFRRVASALPAAKRLVLHYAPEGQFALRRRCPDAIGTKPHSWPWQRRIEIVGKG